MESLLRVLIIEDSEDDYLLVLRELKKHGYSCISKRVDTKDAIGNALLLQDWDIILSDFSMPNLDGLDALDILKKSGLDIPFIIISGAIGEDLVVKSMKAGAHGFIMKGNLSRLIPVVEREIKEAAERKQRRMAEEQLLESERKFRALMENVPVGISLVKIRDGRIQIEELNSHLVHLFGFGSKEEFLNTPKEKLYCNPADMDNLMAIMNNGGARDYELRFRKKDGSVFWASVTSVARAATADIPHELSIVIIHDITGRKLAEEAISESEERFRQIFEQSEDAKIIFECGTFRIMDANPAAIAMYGFTKDALMEAGPALFITEDERKRFVEVMLGMNPGQGFVINRMSCVRSDGARTVVSVKGQIIRLKQCDVVYCTFRDITVMIRMEEEARRIHAKLIHANKMASLGTLASGIAHEINNPNNFIMFNSSLLSDSWKDAFKILDVYHRENGDFMLGGLPFSEMRTVIPELLCGIENGSRRIKSIVDNLKEFSRTEKPGLEEEFDVNRPIMTSISILNNQIAKYTENLQVSCRKGLPPVKGSMQKIEQVIMNLIMNSLQALPDRTRRVEVSTGYDSSAGNVLVTISDEGIGMTKEVLERMTEPFFTTKFDSGGTGLGLSISYSIIKDHNGSIEFDSAPGSGTTAVIKLPACKNPATSAAS